LKRRGLRAPRSGDGGSGGNAIRIDAPHRIKESARAVVAAAEDENVVAVRNGGVPLQLSHLLKFRNDFPVSCEIVLCIFYIFLELKCGFDCVSGV
jgi:hypothetical protein